MSARRITLAALGAAALAACGGEKPAAGGDTAKPAATMAAADTAGFTPLFDAKMTKWRSWKSDSVIAGKWSFSDSVITKDSVQTDLVTRAPYGNFELAFDWKIGPMGNAGIFYRVTDEYDHPYWSGPEYQLRDEAMDPERKDPKLASASVYGLLAPPGGLTKPVHEWNSARIVVKGDSVQHWLNGTLVVQYDRTSADWVGKVKASKFNDYPNFGRAARGAIAIQGDHNGQLGLRNMRIRELP